MRSHGAVALSLFFIAYLGSCDITGHSYSMLPLGGGEPPPPCAPLYAKHPRECAPLPAKDFTGPHLLWYGAISLQAGCPAHAPNIVFHGHSGLLPMEMNQCAACICTPGECVLPAGVSASATGGCEGLEQQPLDANDIWSYSTGPSVRASTERIEEILTSQPAAIFVPPSSIAPCAPQVDAPPPPRIDIVPWQYTGVVCSGKLRDNECSDASTTCAPVDDDYTQCTLYRGPKTDPECPSHYPEKLVLYRGVKNTRRCSACACGPTEGGECTARIFAISPRELPLVASFTTVTTEEPGCLVRNPRRELTGLQAYWLTNDPASCLVSGGERSGVFEPTGAQVLCCRTRPVPKEPPAAGDDPDAGSGDP